ncbi:MAG: hypothetical protein R2729_33140 [Bryobacteraceae bacterium]
MLADITRHSRFTADEFRALATVQPVDPAALHRRIRAMIEDAEQFLAGLPSDAAGVVFVQEEIPVQPDTDHLDRYQRRPGSPGGIWPSSPEITSAMLEHYRAPRDS